MSDDNSQGQATALRILSLDGDGISVLSELTIIHELMYRIQIKLGSQVMPRPCEWFQLIGGTGTGGLVAILLGRLRLSIDEATRCYLSIMTQIFDKKRVKPQNREVELEQILKEMLSRYCNDPDVPMIEPPRETPVCKVILYAMPAAAIQAGTPACIRTYRVAENQGPECTIIEAVRAATATPGILKRKAIYDGEVEVSYVSAGLGCNNPTALLLVEAGCAYPNQVTACVFSAGAGQLHPVSLREHKRLLDSMSSQLAAAAEATAKDCERVHQEVAVRFSHTEGLYFRFNPEQGMQDIDRCDSNRLPDVHTHTKAYLEDVATSRRLNEAVNAITTGKGIAMLLNGNVIMLLQSQLAIGRCPVPSAMFTGREDLLELLRTYFFNQSHERHLFVLHGLGGAGKTQLALEFVHRYKKLFWDVFCIDATTHDTIKAGFKQIAKKAKAGDMSDDALEWLASQKKRWLVMYNNADDPAIDLNDYFPSCAHGDILITTRNQGMVVHALHPRSHCRVSGMQEDDARSLLFKSSGVPKSPESETVATTLVEQLGFLALAIVQAGAYVRSTQCSMTEYLDLFISSRDRLLRTQIVSQTDGYKMTAYATWDVSYRNPRLMARSAQLLGLMSFMHHDGISVEFFKAAAANLSGFQACMPLTREENAMRDVAWDFLKWLTTPANTWDTLRWQELTNNLRSFSLLDYDSMTLTYSVHPLVHSWCRSIISDARSVREHTAWVLGLCVKRRDNVEDYAFRRLLLPHAMAVLTTNGPITPLLAVNLAWVFEDTRDSKQMERLYLYGIKASRERLGFDHATTLAHMHNLAATYKSQGRWDEAEIMLLEVLDSGRPVLGKEHPDVLSIMHTLAATYVSQGRWGEAETMLVEVLEVGRRILGRVHPKVLSSIYTLASTYVSLGRWDEAETMLVEVLETQRQVLGKEHPRALFTMHSLAATYGSQGRWESAEIMLLEALEVQKRVLGKEHPSMLITMRTLASTYMNQGRWGEAEEMLLEVMEDGKPVFSKEHPSMLFTMNALASTYQNQGRWDEAEIILLEVLEVQRQVLRKEHPELLSTMHTLASTYVSQGRWSEAETMLLRVLEDSRPALSKEHPSILFTMYTLASAYQGQGRWDEAETILVEVLEIQRQVLGKEHPRVSLTMHLLAATYKSQGRWERAEIILLEALEVQKRVLGKEHPSMLFTMHTLASTYQSQGRWDEAEIMLLGVLKVQRQVLRKEHPGLLSTIHTLGSTYVSQGRWSEAETILLQVLEDRRAALSKEHPSILFTMYTLASAYRGQGQWDEAETILVEVLETQRQVLGKEHPRALFTMHSLAATYKSQGRWERAEAMLLEVLEVQKRVLGKEHPSILVTMRTLASTYVNQGRWGEAEEMLLGVMEDGKPVFGKEHPSMLFTMHTLASTYRGQGRWDEAEIMLLEVLKVQRQVLRKEHPDLLSTMHTLASTYVSQSRCAEAETMLLEVLEVRRRALGREHPDSIVSTSLLALTYASQRRLKDAELLEMNNLEASKRVLGQQHPDTLTSMYNLASTYIAEGEFVKAGRLAMEALELRKKAIGELHPDTLGSARQLAKIQARLCQSSNP